MSHRRNSKIVATLGPASSTAVQIAALHRAGADLFRLNFSHGNHNDHAQRIAMIRALEAEVRHPIGIIADLQGPKLRIGEFAAGKVELNAGTGFRFDRDPMPGDGTRVPLLHPEVYAALSPGLEILLDDGKMRMRVLRCGGDFAETEVLTSGVLSNRKGLNLPGATLPLSALSAKDREDLDFALKNQVDFVALSFVQRPEDVQEARQIILAAGSGAQIIAKIEKPAALESLSEIIRLSDAIMVARGDLGVELPPELVPAVQKRIVAQCRSAGRPVIVATQMLESMIASPTPTRAEASDVATAVYDGADAVMLSAESASGQYPVEAVTMMSRIITEVERDPLHRKTLKAGEPSLEPTSADAITAAACQVAETVSAAVIVTYTTSGSTTLRASRERPPVPVLGLTSREQTARQLTLAWGVHPIQTADVTNFSEMVERAATIALREGLAVAGDNLVVTAGVPFGTPGRTNSLRVVSLPL